MEILIFKTNLVDKKHVTKARAYLKTLQGILKWNVDLHDIDKVLRIEAEQLSPQTVELALTQAGYYCKELE
ncbi:MAG: hypothetical protein J0I41_07150 [Filimonas sp.]|nr:hypothetical protein [Filimonas sp.]